MIWAAALALITITMPPPASLQQSAHGNRLLIIWAPEPGNPASVQQLRFFDRWVDAARDRDVVPVFVGPNYASVTDSPASVQRRYLFRPNRFEVILVGKDGHVALRSLKPLTGEKLQAAIDAMPMRRAGLR